MPRLLYYLGTLLLAALVVRPVAALTASDLVFFLALLCLLVLVPAVRSEGRSFLPASLLVGVLLFAVGGVFSSLNATEPLLSVAAVVRFLYISLVWFWLGAVLLRGVGQVMVATFLWTLSAAGCGLAALAQLLFGFLPLDDQFNGRMTGLTFHPNDLGGLEAIATVPAIMLLSRRGASRRARLVGLGVLAGVTVGLILSGSVGGLLAAVAGAAVWFATARSRRRYLVAGVLVAAGVALWLSSQGGSDAYAPLARLMAVSGQVDPRYASLPSRLQIDNGALRAIAGHPLLGSGLTDDSDVGAVGNLIHNMLLQVWFGAGLPAVVGLVVVLLSLAAVGRSVLRDAAAPEERHLGLALTIALGTFVLFAMSAPILYVRYGWVSGALLVALRGVQLGRAGAAAAGSPTQTPRVGPAGTPGLEAAARPARPGPAPRSADA